MNAEQEISPYKIEATLKDIWEKLAQENKTRACLFNLLVYAPLSQRVEYVQKVVQEIVEHYPCRILFILANPEKEEAYLKTTISVVSMEEKDCQVACDKITFEVGGKDSEKLPYLVLPHLVASLPVYLLWNEKPDPKNPIFAKLKKLSDKLIFDSETSDKFCFFLPLMQQCLQESQKSFSDLNWVRTESFRDVIASHFYPEEKFEELKKIQKLTLYYNSHTSSYFCHVKIQAIYLQAWIASRLKLTLENCTESENRLVFVYQNNVLFELVPKEEKNLGPGFIYEAKIQTQNFCFNFLRDPKNLHWLTVRTEAKEACELPYSMLLEKGKPGNSLTKELMYRGTSKHFQETLPYLSFLQGKAL